jgi:hypothetical protein
LRNAAFVQSVPDRRLADSILYGVQGTAMPSWIDYGMTQNDVGDLINFIRSLNVAQPQPKAENKSPQQTSTAKQEAIDARRSTSTQSR